MASAWAGAGGRDAVAKPCALALGWPGNGEIRRNKGKTLNICNMMLFTAMWRICANMMKHEKIDSKHFAYRVEGARKYHANWNVALETRTEPTKGYIQ